jgi:hypothetical protein
VFIQKVVFEIILLNYLTRKFIYYSLRISIAEYVCYFFKQLFQGKMSMLNKSFDISEFRREILTTITTDPGFKQKNNKH